MIFRNDSANTSPFGVIQKRQHFWISLRGFTLDLEKIKQKFILKIAININGCWEWTGFKFPKGYGQFSITINGDRYAHRISYFLFKGIDPDKFAVCHTCDNPSCVNPNHMFLGTLNDNNQDMFKKGRGKKGKYFVTHCKNGHEYIDGNITYTKSGGRICRKCVNQKWKDKKNALRQTVNLL